MSQIRTEWTYIRFQNEGHQYSLTALFGGGAMGQAPIETFVGIEVERDGVDVAKLPCLEEPPLDKFEELAIRLPAAVVGN